MNNDGISNDTQIMERGIAQMDHLKAQIESLTVQRDSLASMVMDHDRSIKVLEELVSSASDEFLLPMSGQVFIRARVTQKEICMVDQGAGVLLDRTFPEAVSQLRERRDRIKGAVSGLEKTIQQLVSQYQEVTSRTQEIYDQQMRSGPGPEKTF